MTAPRWSDETLLEVDAWRAAGLDWETIGGRIGDGKRIAIETYSHAKRGGRLARVRAAAGREVAPALGGDGQRPAQTVWAGDDADGPTIIGVTADERPDPGEVWARAEAEWARTAEKRERQRAQEIRFSHGPACLVFMSDLHLGGEGVNYPRIRREVEIAREIPNSGVFLLGDLVDNFIVRKLSEVRFSTRLTISDEWIMAEHVMASLGPRLVACVAGNHDEWSRRASGYDVLRSLVARVRKGVIYDTDEAVVTWRVGEHERRIRARHKWLGSSIYNAIHGQGRAARWDGDADIYIGGHTHRGALYGTLNVGERLVMGVQLGAYKEVDPYQRREGFAVGAPDAAVALVLDEDGALTAYDNLTTAKRVMEALV